MTLKVDATGPEGGEDAWAEPLLDTGSTYGSAVDFATVQHAHF